MKPVMIGAVALLVVGGAVFLLTRAPEVGETTTAVAAPPPAVAPPVAAETKDEPAAPPPEAPERRAAPPRKAAPPPAPVEPAAPTLATLVLQSDVAGASVFINREYVGTTPLRLDRLDPGTAQLKLTVEGYDGIERAVTLSPGDNPVSMRFREVRLNKRMPVAHKHGIGGCDGTLVATLDGLVYESTNKNDAFKLSYAQIDTFVVDYMEKNLRVKQKGGKTWNFTDKAADNADALFVFHRDVEAARKKLADGYAPVR